MSLYHTYAKLMIASAFSQSVFRSYSGCSTLGPHCVLLKYNLTECIRESVYQNGIVLILMRVVGLFMI